MAAKIVLRTWEGVNECNVQYWLYWSNISIAWQ